MTELIGDTNTTPFRAATAPNELPYSLPLELIITDREVIGALMERAEGEDRNHFALEALKIGVLALRHVSGQLNTDLIQRESARLVENMRQTLEQHTRLAQERVAYSLKEYFDPESGRFSERVGRLVGKDGELARLMRGQLDGENSQLARTLLTHVGRESPLMKLLDPQQSEGLLAALRGTVETQLTNQRDHVLREFSLDNDQGALARLVKELNSKHGDLSKQLQTKIDDVVKEFSLDEENSALSRLVRNVDRAQRTITDEFSLNNEASALSRLKREILELFAAGDKKNQQFQEEVKLSLAKLIATRDEAGRSTRHGIAFEDAVCEFIVRQSQQAGDVATPTGQTTGLIKNCKVGDCLLELGPDSAAPGAKVVVEAKQDASYTLARARNEIETARKNRGADWGLFVFSTKASPNQLQPFQRYGNDIVVVWDAEDAATDVYLKAGIMAARALCFRAARTTEAESADFETIERAILEVEKRAANLETVQKHAETIRSTSEKMLDRLRKDREALEKQVVTLRGKFTDLRTEPRG